MSLFLLSALVPLIEAFAGNFGIKTNLVSDALLSPNLGFEVGLARKWSLNASGQLNLWSVNDHKWRHWIVQPEARYWFCRAFTGHFIGIHAIGGEYNFADINADFTFLGSDFSQLRDKRFQGWGVGAGVAYGYAWPVAKHWNIEAEIGIGWIFTRFDAFPCTSCGTRLETGKSHNYYGPTKVAINIEYIF